MLVAIAACKGSVTMTRNSYRLHGLLSRSTITSAGLAIMLAGGTALAEEGGDPAHRISIFERDRVAETVRGHAMPSTAEAEVVPAAATNDDAGRFHDKTEAEWRAYHDAKDALERKNFGR